MGFLLDVATFYTPPREPWDPGLLSALHGRWAAPEIDDGSHREFSHRLSDWVIRQKELGSWSLPHPWFDVLLPAGQVKAFVSNVLAQVDPRELVAGTMLLCPLFRSRLTRPLARVHDDVVVF